MVRHRPRGPRLSSSLRMGDSDIGPYRYRPTTKYGRIPRLSEKSNEESSGHQTKTNGNN